MIQDLLRRLTELERRLERLEAQDTIIVQDGSIVLVEDGTGDRYKVKIVSGTLTLEAI